MFWSQYSAQIIGLYFETSVFKNQRSGQVLPSWDSVLQSSRFKSTHVNYFLKHSNFPPSESPVIDRALKFSLILHPGGNAGEWQGSGHTEACDTLLSMDIPALRIVTLPFQSIRRGFPDLTQIISRPDLPHIPYTLSHLLQLEHSTDVWVDEPLLAVLQGCGHAPGKHCEVLVLVATPVQAHGRDVLQKQQVARHRGDVSSSESQHHNPALPCQTEGKEETKEVIGSNGLGWEDGSVCKVQA